MRFLDPNNGKIYPANQLLRRLDQFCSRCRKCTECPIYKAKEQTGQHCNQFIQLRPAYAARLMGYELLTDEDPEDTPKPPTSPERYQYMSIAKVSIAGLPTVMTYCCTRQSFESLSEKDPTILYCLNDDGTIYLGDTQMRAYK